MEIDSLQQIKIPSRSLEIPAAVQLPAQLPNLPAVPLVVLCHGHAGSKEEGGGYPLLAEKLARRGIASIAVDYPGCGESAESFAKNDMTNMKADTLAAVEYMKSHFQVGEEKTGIFGFSMGGRIALELLADGNRFDAVGLLAPAAVSGEIHSLMDDNGGWAQVQEKAAITGETDYKTYFGNAYKIGHRFFTDIDARPNLIAESAEKYKGPALVIYSTDDGAVHPERVSKPVAAALGAETLEVHRDGHSYGFYGKDRELLEQVTDAAADFFAKHLLGPLEQE